MNKFMLCACGALLAGVSMAATTDVSVTGNNTAVVIQKKAVKSGNDFQFLCVPVKGFDISGKGTVTEPKLGELLPPATFVSSTITLTKRGETESTSYKAEDLEAGAGVHWYPTSGTPKNPVDDMTLSVGDIFWLQSTSENATVFCGEDNVLNKISGIAADSEGMVAAGNASSESIIIKNEFTAGEAGKYVLTPRKTRLFVLQKGSNSYKQYYYESIGNGQFGWTKSGTGHFRVLCEDSDVIAPGEAFYIQNASLKTQVNVQ